MTSGIFGERSPLQENDEQFNAPAPINDSNRTSADLPREEKSARSSSQPGTHILATASTVECAKGGITRQADGPHSGGARDACCCPDGVGRRRGAGLREDAPVGAIPVLDQGLLRPGVLSGTDHPD